MGAHLIDWAFMIPSRRQLLRGAAFLGLLRSDGRGGTATQMAAVADHDLRQRPGHHQIRVFPGRGPIRAVADLERIHSGRSKAHFGRPSRAVPPRDPCNPGHGTYRITASTGDRISPSMATRHSTTTHRRMSSLHRLRAVCRSKT
jgi:hypothetical protein